MMGLGGCHISFFMMGLNWYQLLNLDLSGCHVSFLSLCDL